MYNNGVFVKELKEKISLLLLFLTCIIVRSPITHVWGGGGTCSLNSTLDL